MAYSTPRTWAAGERPTAAQFNQDIRDNVSFLANPPACRVYHNTTQSLTDSTPTTLVFNSERYDTDGMHSMSSDTSRITINTAGLYLVHFTAQLAAAADYTMIYALFRLNNTTTIGQTTIGTVADAASAGPTPSFATVYKFAAADYVEVHLFQNNSANAARNVLSNGNFSPEFAATWIGLG